MKLHLKSMVYISRYYIFADAPEERAINFVLDVQDTYLAATQTGIFQVSIQKPFQSG